MTAPLSRFLTRFSAPHPPVFVELEPLASPRTVTLTEAELDARLEAAARTAESDAERRHAIETEEIVSANEGVLAEAIAKARAEWTEMEGARLGTLLELRLNELCKIITDQTASVLRPILAEAAMTSAIRALADALDRLLADPKAPMLRVCGPADLLDALRDARPAAAVEWVVTEATDITITADATLLQTHLASALTAIAATET